MGKLPGAIFVVDTTKESIAVNEAVKLNIPIIAMVDTNSDPDIPDYIIPCNDDSARTIQLVAGNIADAIIAGTAERAALREEELYEQAAKESSEKEAEAAASSQDARGFKKRRRDKRPGTGGSGAAGGASRPVSRGIKSGPSRPAEDASGAGAAEDGAEG
jgi:small subunit ribosomal protein S2